MEKTKEKVRKIIKESFEANVKVISWDGMHERATNEIMEIFWDSHTKRGRGFKKSEKKT